MGYPVLKIRIMEVGEEDMSFTSHIPRNIFMNRKLVKFGPMLLMKSIARLLKAIILVIKPPSGVGEKHFRMILQLV